MRVKKLHCCRKARFTFCFRIKSKSLQCHYEKTLVTLQKRTLETLLVELIFYYSAYTFTQNLLYLTLDLTSSQASVSRSLVSINLAWFWWLHNVLQKYQPHTGAVGLIHPPTLTKPNWSNRVTSGKTRHNNCSCCNVTVKLIPPFLV